MVAVVVDDAAVEADHRVRADVAFVRALLVRMRAVRTARLLRVRLERCGSGGGHVEGVVQQARHVGAGRHHGRVGVCVQVLGRVASCSAGRRLAATLVPADLVEVLVQDRLLVVLLFQHQR